ncbi:MAG: phytoene desaturase [Polyangiaceae bacterium]|nr:phytoene desaturase [Polyangiaceae bacterium]
MRGKRNRKVLVIGAGLGGIAAAITLATEGFDVEVLEKNERIGGKLNVLEKEGFSFDLGPSIIILPQLFRRVFDRAGVRMEDYVTLRALDPQWRGFFTDGTRLDLCSDLARMERELERLGPSAAGYFSFLEHSRRMWKFAERAYLEPASQTATEIIQRSSAAELADRAFVATMYQGVTRYLKEPHLRDMLAFFSKYVGSSPYDSPGMMNLLAYSQLGYGLWYVEGGMYNLARAYGRLMDELGIVVRLGTEVTAITSEASRVTGVALADGTRLVADAIVSNMEVIPVYERLLPEGRKLLPIYRRHYEPAASGLVLHLGIAHDYPQLLHHNFFYSADAESFCHTIHRHHRLPRDPHIYLVCPTKTEPSLAPPGHSIIKALPHIPCIQDPPFTRQDYEGLREQVLDKLERMGLVGLRKHVVVDDMLVPDDIERLYYSNRGAIYGVINHWRKNYSLKAPQRSEVFPNLYFAGGSTNPGGGTCMVVLSGQNAGMMLSRSL